MDVQMDLPTAVEGAWKLVTAEGGIIASSSDHQDAALIVTPHFYRNQHTQTVSRVTVRGKKGRRVQQVLRIGGNAGTIRAEALGEAPKPIVPGFDKDSGTKSTTKSETKPNDQPRTVAAAAS